MTDEQTAASLASALIQCMGREIVDQPNAADRAVNVYFERLDAIQAAKKNRPDGYISE